MVLEIRGLTRLLEIEEASTVGNSKNVSKNGVKDLVEPEDQLVSEVHEKPSQLIFSNISFSLPKGRIVAIQGVSGCGKTQLLRSIAQLDPVNGGDVLLNGKTPEEVGYNTWRAKVCLVTQSHIKIVGDCETPKSYFTSIMSFDSHVERHTRFADPVAIAAKWDVNPSAFDLNWSDLTSSEHIRISLAIAIASRPDVLLLDEPTAGLDTAASLLIERTIRALGLSVIWATQDIFQAERVADTVLIFNQKLDETPAPSSPKLESSSASSATPSKLQRSNSSLVQSTTHRRKVTIDPETIPESAEADKEYVAAPKSNSGVKLVPILAQEAEIEGALQKISNKVSSVLFAADAPEYEVQIVHDKLDFMLDDPSARKYEMTEKQQLELKSDKKAIEEAVSIV